MNLSIEEKERLIDTLSNTKRKAQKAIIRLLFQGKESEADQLKLKTKVLSEQIDALLGQSMDEWIDQSTSSLSDVKKINTNVQSAITKIEKKENVVKMAVKVSNYIDDAIKISKKLIK